MQGPKLYISIFILFIIALHALPVLQELRGNRQTFWPVMAWGMYRQSYDSKRPVQTSLRHITAITAGGESLQIEAPESGLGYFGFLRFYLGPMSTGDSLAADRLADRINHDRNDPIVEFRLEDVTYTVTHNGIVREVKPVVTYRVGH